MGTNKFFVFDENRANLLSDQEYQNSDYRKGGAVAGIAPSNVHNKMYLQSSTMAAAIAQVIADTGKDVSDSDFNLLVSQIKESLGGSTSGWRRKHHYNVSDISTPSAIGSYKYAECTVAGTSGSVEPTWPAVGETVTDGTVTWIIRDIRAAYPLLDGTGIAKTLDIITKGPVCDVRFFGIYPDGVTDWRDNGKLATALQWASSNKIPLYFPAGLYKSYFDNYWSDVTCIFEEGAEFAGVIHVAINDASGTPSQNRPSNVRFIGTVTTYARVGTYNCDDVYIERIHIKSDPTKNAQGVKPHGVHIYLDSKNINIGEIIVDDIGSNQYYGVGLDGSYTYHPSNVHIGRIHVKDSETHGVYLWGDNITVDNILVDGYGAGTQTATLEGATGPESAITHGFWSNMTTNSRIGRIEVNQKPGRTAAGEGVYFDAGKIEVGSVVARKTAGAGITVKAQVETPIVYAGYVEASNCGGYGINLVRGVLYAHTVLAQANSLDGILISTGCALKANIVNSVSNVQRQIYAGGNSKISVQHMEATDHTNAAYDAVRIGGAINSKIGTLYITCPTKGLAGGLFANDLNNVCIGQLYTLNCGVDASHCAARIETSTNVTIGAGLLKDGLGQGLRIVTVTDLNINGMTVDGHDTNIAGASFTRVGLMNCRSVNWTTAKSNIAAASVATFNCTDMTN